MSYISMKKVKKPHNILLEVIPSLTRNYESILWISGPSSTYFYKIENKKYQLNLKKKIDIQTGRYTNILKHYYSLNYKKSLPKLNMPLSSLYVKINRTLVGSGVGFKKYLRVRGVGYKFELDNRSLIAKVGFTHLLKKIMPSDFETKFSRKFKVVRFRSKSLSRLTVFTAMFRSLKKPDVYKGKGIRYNRDPMRRKPGKRKTKAVSKKKKFNTKNHLHKKLKKKKRRRKIKISFKQFGITHQKNN